MLCCRLDSRFNKNEVHVEELSLFNASCVSCRQLIFLQITHLVQNSMQFFSTDWWIMNELMALQARKLSKLQSAAFVKSLQLRSWPSCQSFNPIFFNMKPLGIFLYFYFSLSWIGGYFIAGLPPAVNLPHCESSVLPKNTIQCPRQGHEPSPSRGETQSRNTPSHFMLQKPDKLLSDGPLGLYTDSLLFLMGSALTCMAESQNCKRCFVTLTFASITNSQCYVIACITIP